MRIYAWLSDEENEEMNRRDNPAAYEQMDAAIKRIKKMKGSGSST